MIRFPSPPWPISTSSGEIADAVHANGGKVIGTIDITSPWILTNLEPYCDALLGGFGTSTQALIDVITGEYSPHRQAARDHGLPAMRSSP